MDNGDSLLDVIDDTSELFGGQNDATGQMFDWDELLGDNETDASGGLATKSGNLEPNVNQSSLLLTSQNYAAVTSSIPAQSISIASSRFLQTSSSGNQDLSKAVMPPSVVGQTVVNPLQNIASPTGLTTQIIQQGNQQFILKTASGNQIQLSSQAQLQLQQQLLQQQQQQQQQAMTATSASHFQHVVQSASPAPSSSPMHNRSITPNSGGGLSVPFVTHSSGNLAQLKSTSPAPNVNIVHLPSSAPQQQIQQPQQQIQQQVQLAPGTFLLQGQPTVIGNPQQGAVVNAQNTVIQNPNVVNVNVAAQHVLCNNPTQQVQPRGNFGLANLQTTPQNPFNIQGTLIQTAEGKSILIPSQQMAQPINIQQLSVAAPLAQAQAQAQVQQPASVGNMIRLAQQQQQSSVAIDNSSSQALQHIVLNSQGQQILLQRAPGTGNQPQNIIVRAGNQPGILQVQQRPGQSAPLQNAQQALQALASGGSQQVKIINQPGVAQSNVPMINIGGQNVTLQQLSNQLGSVQAIQLLQQQQQQQQQQQNLVPQQVTLQHNPIISSAQTGLQSQIKSSQLQQQVQVLTSSQGNLLHVTSAPTQVTMGRLASATPPSQNKDSSVDSQTQHILQQIKNSLKMSQSNSVSSVVPSYSSSSPAPNVNIMNIKQENLKVNFPSSSSMPSSANIPEFPRSNVKVKSDPNLIETLIKQEQTKTTNSCSMASSAATSLSSSSDMAGFQGLLTNTAQTTAVTTTVSQAATSMSMFVLSNSRQTVLGSNVQTTASAMGAEGTVSANAHTNLQTQSPSSSVKNDIVNNETSLSSPLSTQQIPTRPPGGATLQTIHLPPDLQAQFQRVQLEIKKVQAATNMTVPQKQRKLQHLQMFQKKILLQGRVLATTKAEPHQIQQGIAALAQIRKPSVEGMVNNQDNTQQMTSVSHSSASSSQASPGSTQISAAVSASDSLGQVRGQGQTGWQGQSVTNTQMSQQDNTSNLNQLKGPVVSMPKSSSQMLSNLLASHSQQSHLVPQATPTQQATTPTQQATTPTQQATMPTQQATIPTRQATTTPTQPVGVQLSQPGSFQATSSVSVSSPQQDQTVSTTTTAAAAQPQVAVPTQIKIANKVLTLSLTPAQKAKVQSYLDRMTPEQQQQYLQTQQGVLQRIQRQQQMNAQIRAQVDAQRKQAAMTGNGATTVEATPTQTLPGPVTQISPTKVQTDDVPSMPSKSEMPVVKPEVKVIPIPTKLAVSGPSDGTTAVRGIKRSYLDIPKGTLINQQIRQDQNHAVNPDTKRPFKSRSDACRRLLRYHVFQTYGPSPEEIRKFDDHTEDLSKELLRKKDWMFERFRHLLLQESLRVEPSSELVMLQRMQNQELRKLIEEEKRQIKTDPESFVPMPRKFLKRDKSSDENADSCEFVTVKKEPSDDETISEIKVEVKGEVVEDVTVKSELEESYEQMEEGLDLKTEHGEDIVKKPERVKKLVIRSDGQNYSSSFKRGSIDSIRSSMDSRMDVSVVEGDMHSIAIEETAETVTSLSADSEDTNEYTNDSYGMNDEAEQAALAISEESQDSQTDDEDEEMSFRSSGASQQGTHFTGLQSQFSGDGGRNYELTGNSIYYGTEESNDMMSSSVEKLKSFSSMAETSSGTYVPSHSPVSNDSSDVMNVNLQSSGGNGDFLDKFNLYQPITENLSDSEENSYYPMDSINGQTGVDRDTNGPGKGSWDGTTSAHIIDDDSDEESDQEVKAQMESAINSILSLSQGAPNETDESLYSFSQSNQFFSNTSQPNVSFRNSSGIPRLKDNGSGEVESEVEDDLDSAVNSILM